MRFIDGVEAGSVKLFDSIIMTRKCIYVIAKKEIVKHEIKYSENYINLSSIYETQTLTLFIIMSVIGRTVIRCIINQTYTEAI